MKKKNTSDWNTGLDFGFSNNFDIKGDIELISSRYIDTVSKSNFIPARYLTVEKANDFAKQIDIFAGDYRYYCILSGEFVLGDFIAGLIVENDLEIDEMHISTLSLSRYNIDNLVYLLEEKYVNKLYLHVSRMFAGNEMHIRDKNPEPLIPYIRKTLDNFGDRFQIAVSDSHMKVIMWTEKKDEYGHIEKVTIHGSANLRASQNIEQICIENAAELYDFNKVVLDSIFSTFFTIRHEVKNEIQDAIGYKKLYPLIKKAVENRIS